VSRQVDMTDPGKWSDEDKEYLRQRIDSVPVALREHLAEDVPLAPAVAAESPEMSRLRRFLELNYPEEMASTEQGDTPVGVAIRILSEGDDVVDPDTVDDVDYSKWNAKDIKAEVDRRRESGRPIQPEGNTKADYINALKADDAAQAAGE
jgi:hypothetical protein